ncbi:MAG: hypothetical protein C5B51_02100 [Terriglobia bacterium]|nr:MAG: hypothetical protein C5B51_02100 [Terriglobia bacterium]
MRPNFLDLPTSIKLTGKAIPGALDRQAKISGFDQDKFSQSHVLLIGAGGLGSNIARTLVRKGVGRLTIIDPDVVEASNLNRQHFYEGDIGEYKALALVRNLLRECTAATEMSGHAVSLEQAIESGMNLRCNVAVCGVDNNPARVLASGYFRKLGRPVIFLAVSADADHGYVFVQEPTGACIGCLFPDIGEEGRFPCPCTPAIIDILQVLCGIAVCAISTTFGAGLATWNYYRFSFSGSSTGGSAMIPGRPGCGLCHPNVAPLY